MVNLSLTSRVADEHHHQCQATARFAPEARRARAQRRPVHRPVPQQSRVPDRAGGRGRSAAGPPGIRPAVSRAAGRPLVRRPNCSRTRRIAVRPMKAVFADTAGWMACADAAAPAHKRACASRDAALERGEVLVATDYVLDETLTLIRMRLGLADAKAWWERIGGRSRLRAGRMR